MLKSKMIYIYIYTLFRVMLKGAFGTLVKHANKEIKNKSNNDKITFYTFKILNSQFSKKKKIS
jgi:hypothetical protein